MIKKKLSIAMIAPPFGDTGGPEVVTKNLTNALLKLGVDVTLFAPGDWKTSAKHVETLSQSIWAMKDYAKLSFGERLDVRIGSQTKVLQNQQDFDLIHLHSQRYAHLVAEKSQKPCVLTFHNKMTDPEFSQAKNAGIFTVALSETQRKDFPVSAIIENGIDVSSIQPSFEKGKYLITIGRLTEEKGVDIAIKLAIQAKEKLLIFGRKGNSPERQEYFAQKIAPFLNENMVYMGEASQSELFKYLREAKALLFPIKRNIKVCPLTMIESLACGTPVVGTAMDPMPKCLADPSVACLSKDFEEMLDAIKKADSFDRKECRKIAEENFDSSIMAKKYIELYEKILKESK